MKTIKNILCTILVSILIPCTCLGAGNGRNNRRGNGQGQNSPRQTRQVVNNRVNTGRTRNSPTENPTNPTPQGTNVLPVPPTITLSSPDDFYEYTLNLETPTRNSLIESLHEHRNGDVRDAEGNIITHFEVRSRRGDHSLNNAINNAYMQIPRTRQNNLQSIPEQSPEPEQPTTRNDSGSDLESGQQRRTTEQQQPVYLTSTQNEEFNVQTNNQQNNQEINGQEQQNDSNDHGTNSRNHQDEQPTVDQNGSENNQPEVTTQEQQSVPQQGTESQPGLNIQEPNDRANDQNDQQQNGHGANSNNQEIDQQNEQNNQEVDEQGQQNGRNNQESGRQIDQGSNGQVDGQSNNQQRQQQQENSQENQETPVNVQESQSQQQPTNQQGDQQNTQQQPENLQENQQQSADPQEPPANAQETPVDPQGSQQPQAGQQGVHPWVLQAQQLAANMQQTNIQQNVAPLAAQNNLPGVYRNDVFEQTNILRQNAHVVHEIMKDSAQRGVNLKAGYLKHKQSVARGLGYDADTFLLAGTLSSGPVNVWGDQTCTFALAAAYTDTSADYKGKYIKSKKEKNCSKEKTFFFGPYVAYNLDRLNINASFLYGHTKYDTSRALPKDAALTTWSRKNNVSYNGDSMHGNVTLSYTWTFANFHVQPQLGVQYDHVVQKSHNLKINNNTTAIKKQKLDFVSPFAGVRVSADVNLSGGKQSLVPYVFVGVSRDVHRHASVANKNVLNGNPVTTIVYPGSRDMLITAAGVQWKSDWPVTLDLEYRGVFSGHRRSHEVLGGLGYSF